METETETERPRPICRVFESCQTESGAVFKFVASEIYEAYNFHMQHLLHFVWVCGDVFMPEMLV